MHEYRCWVPAINRPIFVNQALNILANRLAHTSTCNAYHRRIVRFYDVINPFIKIFVAPKNGRLLAKIRRRNIHRLPIMAYHVTSYVRCALSRPKICLQFLINNPVFTLQLIFTFAPSY